MQTKYVPYGITILLMVLSCIAFLWMWALDTEPKSIPMEQITHLQEQEGGIWVDFFADTGDGWDSTFAVATTLAQPQLSFYNLTLPRGSTLIVGGDIVYPYPTLRLLHERFIAPFETALKPFCVYYSERYPWFNYPLPMNITLYFPNLWQPHEKNESHWANRTDPLVLPQERHEMANWCHPEQVFTKMLEKFYSLIGNHPGFRTFKRWSDEEYKNQSTPALQKHFDEFARGYSHWLPEMFLIPGNHDSMDGFASFARLLERANVGGWKLNQTRQYFAVVKGKWLILGVHDQHAAGQDPDIDMEQLFYFLNYLAEKEELGMQFNIILVMHSPFWALKRNPGEYLSRLLIRIGSSLKAVIAGDMHYYSHYVPENGGPHLIISGGGGAFLHSTYLVPQSLNVTLHSKAAGLEYTLKKVFPEKHNALSRLRNLRNNRWFCGYVMGFSYLFYVVWKQIQPSNIKLVQGTSMVMVALAYCMELERFLVLSLIEIGVCFAALTVTFRDLHAVLEAKFKPQNLKKVILSTGCVIMYCLLSTWIAVTLFPPLLHRSGVVDEGFFGPLGEPDFKNFIRFHIHPDHLEGFVVGLKKAFPRDIEVQTAYDVDLSGNRSDARGQRYASVVDQNWFQNNLVLVENFVLSGSLHAEEQPEDRWIFNSDFMRPK